MLTTSKPPYVLPFEYVARRSFASRPTCHLFQKGEQVCLCGRCPIERTTEKVEWPRVVNIAASCWRVAMRLEAKQKSVCRCCGQKQALAGVCQDCGAEQDDYIFLEKLVEIGFPGEIWLHCPHIVSVESWTACEGKIGPFNQKDFRNRFELSGRCSHCHLFWYDSQLLLHNRVLLNDLFLSQTQICVICKQQEVFNGTCLHCGANQASYTWLGKPFKGEVWLHCGYCGEGMVGPFTAADFEEGEAGNVRPNLSGRCSACNRWHAHTSLLFYRSNQILLRAIMEIA